MISDDNVGGGRHYYRPIPGARIREVPDDRVPVTAWMCDRCGQRVNASGTHLVIGAPCRDCREFLREYHGDNTLWDKRRIRERDALRPQDPISGTIHADPGPWYVVTVPAAHVDPAGIPGPGWAAADLALAS